MGKYLFHRILVCLPVLFLVSLLVFGVGCLVPGDSAAVILGPDAAPGDILALRARLGLDLGLPGRYARWIGGALRLDLGYSSFNGLPVAELLARRMGPTVSLAVFSLALSALIAIPLGMAAALRKGSLVDLCCSLGTLAGVSVPGFLLGLFMILIFAVKLRWFPAAGYVPLSGGIGAHLRSIALPGFALSLMYAALLMRVTRSSLLGILGSDYVRAARSKGAGEWILAFRHGFPNVLAPVLTIMGQGFIGALTGAAVLESVFGIPGIGALTASSISRRDLPVIQAVVLLFALINQGLNLLLDLLCALADPRIRIVTEARRPGIP